jgi:hypothetical protein
MKHNIVSAIAVCAFLLTAMLFIAPTFAGPYPDYPTFIAQFKALATTYPQLVSYQIIGKSVLGQDILMFTIGNPSGEVVLFDGALHGYEAEGSQLLYYYAQWLLTSNDPLAQEILANTCTLLVPVVNVDDYFINRTNAHGVDLNRNFATNWQYGGSTDPTSDTYRGPSPLSEPESQALENVYYNRKPSAYVNIHDGDGEKMYASSYMNSTYLASLISKIDSMSAQRGVASYGSPIVISGPGEAITDAAKAGASASFVLEIGNGTRTLSEVEADVLPRFIPIAAVLSQENESGNNVLFTDSFESGDFSNWDGTQTTTGATLSVNDEFSRVGTHSALFTSDGSDALETAYLYKNVESSPDIFARGYFLATSFTATGNYSRFYFAAFAVSGQTVAMAGCLTSGNTTWWRLAVTNGSNLVITDTETGTVLNQWYRFELQWAQGETDGYCKLYVNDELVCSVQGINTTAYGSVNSADFGIVMSEDAQTSFYLNYVQVSRVSLGPLPIPEDINQDGKIDVRDLAIIARSYGAVYGSPQWDPRADLDANGRIDVYDLMQIASHYMEEDATLTTLGG